MAFITNFDNYALKGTDKSLRNNDEPALREMLSPSTYKIGASPVLTEEEQAMIVERLIFARKIGFAVGKDALKSIMTKIASDESPSWKSRAPTDDTIRAFGLYIGNCFLEIRIPRNI